MKKIFLLIVLIIFTGCGYQPMFITQKSNFSISEINHDQAKISKMIATNLNHFKETENKFISYNLSLSSQESRVITLKNARGESSNFRLKIIVEVNFFENEELKLKRIYEEKFEYKNTSKKFELSQYEDKIKNQMVRKISERIILDLYEIK
tara:strand:- start:1508 stop:1960 length:453 start_codon:yes stop_codon:yes gene_type:complete